MAGVSTTWSVALSPTAESPVTDLFRHRNVPLSMLAIGLVGLLAQPDEAAARASARTARHAVKAAPAKTAKTARVRAPSVEAKSPAAKPAELKEASTAPAGVWTAGEQERSCFRGRRKLWQPGEGWVVKKVSLCP